jgi:hypothetical protein
MSPEYYKLPPFFFLNNIKMTFVANVPGRPHFNIASSLADANLNKYYAIRLAKNNNPWR